MPKAILTVTNDLVTDQRAHRVAITLMEMGFDVLLIGRRFNNSKKIDRPYEIKRFKLLFNRSWLFYANYNLRVFFYLLFAKKYELVVANDLDTLLAAQIAANVRCKKLVFDAHEYFTEVPELIDKSTIKNIWGFFEKYLVPKADMAYTVCQSLASIYQEKYGVKFHVIRNLPYRSSGNQSNLLKEKFNGKNVILYQGSVNVGRGLELIIETMRLLENAVFVIIGDGDIRENLEEKVEDLNLSDKVIFLGRIPFALLPAFTRSADIGLSVEEDLGLNYHYALPNKIFDYIQAEIPVLVSDLPEMRSIVNKHDIGMVIKKREKESLAHQINQMLCNSDLRNRWNNNLKKAANMLCWENEREKLEDIYKRFL